MRFLVLSVRCVGRGRYVLSTMGKLGEILKFIKFMNCIPFLHTFS